MIYCTVFYWLRHQFPKYTLNFSHFLLLPKLLSDTKNVWEPLPLTLSLQPILTGDQSPICQVAQLASLLHSWTALGR